MKTIFIFFVLVSTLFAEGNFVSVFGMGNSENNNAQDIKILELEEKINELKKLN